jgi:hypothetical protein
MKNAIVFVCCIALGLCVIAAHRAFLVSQLRQPVLEALNNPRDAEFRNEIYLGDWTAVGGTLCGEVSVPADASTSQGYQLFSVSRGVFIENDDLRRQFDQAGISRCKRTGKPAGTPWWWLYW